MRLRKAGEGLGFLLMPLQHCPSKFQECLCSAAFSYLDSNAGDGSLVGCVWEMMKDREMKKLVLNTLLALGLRRWARSGPCQDRFPWEDTLMMTARYFFDAIPCTAGEST